MQASTVSDVDLSVLIHSEQSPQIFDETDPVSPTVASVEQPHQDKSHKTSRVTKANQQQQEQSTHTKIPSILTGDDKSQLL